MTSSHTGYISRKEDLAMNRCEGSERLLQAVGSDINSLEFHWVKNILQGDGCGTNF